MLRPIWLSLGFALISGFLACSESPTALLPACPPDPFADIVPPDTGWRAQIQAQVASVPADTVLEAGIMYRDSVTVGDRAVLQEAGAVLVSEVTVVPAVYIRLPASDLAQLAAPGGPLEDSRVELVELGRPVCLAMAQPNVHLSPG